MNPALIRAALQRIDFSKRLLAKDILISLAELVEAQRRLTQGVEAVHGLGSIYFALQAFLAAAEPEGPRSVARRGNVFSRDQKPNLKIVSVPMGSKPDAAFDELVVQIKRYCGEIERTLGQLLGVPEPQLAERLVALFGTEMSEHGRKTDATMNPVQLSAVERARHRVQFRGGRAYYLRERLGLPAHEAVLDTLHFEDRQNFGKDQYRRRVHRMGAWGFVLSMDRQFYVAQHGFVHQTGGNKDAMFFHSSYLSGARVFCAGDCIVRNGQFESITNASGHYKPPAETLAYVVETLRQNGVDVSDLRVGTMEDNDFEDLSDPEQFADCSVPAYEFIQFRRGGVASGFALDAVPPRQVLEVVKSGLAAYRARFRFNPSRESKAAVSLLNKLVQEEEALQARGSGGSRKLADAIAYLLGKAESPGSLDFGASPLKQNSSLYRDLAQALTKLKTGKVTLDPKRLPAFA
ncbi:hypothetical protein GXW71_17525 [Roseomonas hellenica]|uniref:Uncharacterized protein n=1 Tax=Plastoroseomonas hellenica TaxID=2687306 RepID=A0ABS5F215_9PROT|nr:hypothetical protein [Plastoroseomonas hellenica]MBR0666165.1 hypothetical protein [Plastoroseomonas hellenica]